MTREPASNAFPRLRAAMTEFRDAYERSRRAKNPPLAAGGRITGPARTDDAVLCVLSRGHVQLPRGTWDAMGRDTVARLNACDDGSFGRPMRPDVTIVEPDGSLTEVEVSGP